MPCPDAEAARLTVSVIVPALLYRESRPFRRRAPLVAGVRIAAGAVTLAELLRASVRSRAPLF